LKRSGESINPSERIKLVRVIKESVGITKFFIGYEGVKGMVAMTNLHMGAEGIKMVSGAMGLSINELLDGYLLIGVYILF
jgi:hypothetical protein